MKKIVMLFCLLMCTSLFSNEKNINVVIEPTFTISKEEITNGNLKISEEIKKEIIENKLFQNTIFQMFSSFQSTDSIEKEMVTKILEISYKYIKIEISEINYVSPNKAYVNLSMKTPDIYNNMDKIQKKMGENLLSQIENSDFYEKNKNLSIEELAKRVQRKIVEEIIKLIEEESAKIAKENKYLISKFIIKVEKKGNNWKLNKDNFQMMKSY